jgi:hypothetical protein
MMSQRARFLRKHLHADALFCRIRCAFERLIDSRPEDILISLADALMSAFAMFSLKDPSLLAFDKRRTDASKVKNLKTVYQIGTVPCDTQMREIVDPVEPDELSPIYDDIFRQLQRGKVLAQFSFLEGCYLLSVDGTQYFSSPKIHCSSCLESTNASTGGVTYSHQMLAAALVHPDRSEVIPVFPEPITKQDGATHNDCERNAAKRFVEQFRRAHPQLNVIITEDSLHSNAPHIRTLQAHHMHFIIGAKPGDHAWLFQRLDEAVTAGTATEFTLTQETAIHRFRFVNEVALNESNQDLLVNVLEYWERLKDGSTQHFTWVTDIPITPDNAYDLMRGGRARWKIENETFNTLKNQGYHFEHNYGHGQQHLSVVFALLMMLAFLVDQVQQIACPLFQAVLQKEGCRMRMWEHVRALFYSLEFDSMAQLFRAYLYGYRVTGFVILDDSS